MSRRPTNRWTRAAVAPLATSSVRRGVIEFAPPRQLHRYTVAAFENLADGLLFQRLVEVANIARDENNGRLQMRECGRALCTALNGRRVTLGRGITANRGGLSRENTTG